MEKRNTKLGVKKKKRQEIDSKNLRTEIEIKDFAFPGHENLIAREAKTKREEL